MAVTASYDVVATRRESPARGRHSAPVAGRHSADEVPQGRHAAPLSNAPRSLRLPSATVAICGIAALATVGAVAASAAGPRDQLSRTVSAAAVVGSGSVALPVAGGAPADAAPVSAPRGADPGTAGSGTTAAAAAPVDAVAGLGAERRLGRLTVGVVSVRVLDTLGATGDGTRIIVDLVVRSTGSATAMTPSVELVCANTRDTGNYYADGTLGGARELREGESVTGSVVLGMPASLGARPCVGATLRLVDPVPPPDDPRGLGPALEVPVPADVLPGG